MTLPFEVGFKTILSGAAPSWSFFLDAFPVFSTEPVYMPDVPVAVILVK